MSGYGPPQNSKTNLNTGTSDDDTNAKEVNKGRGRKKSPARSIVIKDSDEILIPNATTHPIVTADVKETNINPVKVSAQLRIADDDNNVETKHSKSLKPETLLEPIDKSPLIDYKAVIESERLEKDTPEPFDYAEIMNDNRADLDQGGNPLRSFSKSNAGERTYSYIFFKVPQPINDTLKQRLCEVSLNAKQCLDDKGFLNDEKSASESDVKKQIAVEVPHAEDDRTDSIESYQVRVFDELGTFNFSKASTESKRDVENVIQALINKVASENGKTTTEPKCFRREPFEEDEMLRPPLKADLEHSIKEISRFLKKPMASADVLRADYQRSLKVVQPDIDGADDAKIISDSEAFGKKTRKRTKIDDSEKFDDTILEGKLSNTTLANTETQKVDTQKADAEEPPKGVLQTSDPTEVKNIKTTTESELLIKQLLDPFKNITTTGEDKGQYSMASLKEAQNLDKMDSNYDGKTEKPPNEIPQPVNESLAYSETIIGSVKVPQSLNYSGIQEVKKEFRLSVDSNGKSEIKPKRSLKLTQIFDNDESNNAVKEINMFLNMETIDIDEPKSELEVVEGDKTEALLQAEAPAGAKIELIVEKSVKDVSEIAEKEIPKLSDLLEGKLLNTTYQTHIHSEELVNMPLIGSQESLLVPPPSCTTEENETNAGKPMEVDPVVEPKQIELQLKSLQLNKSYVSFNTIDDLRKSNSPQETTEKPAQYSNSFPFRLQSAPLLQLYDYTVNTDSPDRPFSVPKCPNCPRGGVEVTDTVTHEQSGLGTLLRLDSSENLQNESKVCTVQLATGSHSSQTNPEEHQAGGKVIQARKWREASSQERFRMQLPRKYESYPKAEGSRGLKSASFSVPMNTAVSRVSFSVPLASNISSKHIDSSKEGRKSPKKELKETVDPSSSDSFRMRLPCTDMSTQVGSSLLEIQKAVDPISDLTLVPFNEVLYKDSEEMLKRAQEPLKSRDNVRILDSREEVGRSVELFPSKTKQVATSSKQVDSASQNSASTSHKKIRLKDWTSPIRSLITTSYNFFRRRLRRKPAENAPETIRCNPHKKRPKDRHSKVVYIESTVL